ncbi:MAG: amidohydrolase family protein [Alphaproteobacteria bacterium]
MASLASSTPIIDIHAHLKVPGDVFKGLLEIDARPSGERGVSDPGLAAALSNADARIADMDRLGIDISALTPAPPRGFYGLDGESGLAVARLVNDYAAEFITRSPNRLVSLGVLPLQDVDRSVLELNRAVTELGLKGVRINTNINRKELDDPIFEPFWARAEELGTLVFLHPQYFTEPARLGDFNMGNMVGQPLETTLALTHIILGGVLERHPRVKLIAAHGGGYFPFYTGRFDEAQHMRPDYMPAITRPPSSYLKTIYFDTIIYRPEAVSYLADLVGIGQIVMGTDRPYDTSLKDPVGLIRSVTGLCEADQGRILGGTAAALLGLA